jgi:aerobic C4-dicarboxylate transport protein
MKRLVRNLTFQVVVGIVLGVVLGAVAPGTARAMKPLGDLFVNLVKMVIAPVIFVTIVLGIAGMEDLKKVGRVGGKALLYFEIITTFALAIGVVIANVLRPGDGLDVRAMAGGDVSKFTAGASHLSAVQFLMHVVPDNMLGAFTQGDVLQVVFVAVLTGVALAAVGSQVRGLVTMLDWVAKVLFKIVAIIMWVAPIGAFGAMAFTVGSFGLESLLPLAKLLAAVYLTMLVFVLGVLGLIARAYGFRITSFLRYIKEELLIVLGTSSSETVLPQIMLKLERFGCARSVVGLVVPAGYSFNLDGTSIYLSMAVIFLAQAFHVHLSLLHQLGIIGVLMLTSKGAAGVTGSGFIVLASTLAAMRVVPVEGIALLLGVDRFMSTARALVNLVGNGVATIVVAKSEREFGVVDAVLGGDLPAAAEGEMRVGIGTV